MVKGELVADVSNSQHAGIGAIWRINTKILWTCNLQLVKQELVERLIHKPGWTTATTMGRNSEHADTKEDYASDCPLQSAPVGLTAGQQSS